MLQIPNPDQPNFITEKHYFFLFISILCFYLLFSPAHFLTTPDEELNLRTTLSLVQGQRGAIPPLPLGFASKRGIDGREYAQYGLGVPITSSLWCRIGLLLDPSKNQEANDLRTINEVNQAGTHFLRAWMTVWGMILTALSAVFCFAIFLQIGLTPRIAFLSTLLYAFGTITWPHGRTFFTEPLVAFCLSGALLCLLKAPAHEHPSRLQILAAILWAYAVLTRLDTLITGPAAAWFFLVTHKENQYHLRLQLKDWIRPAIPFALVLVVIFLYNQFRFDSFFSTGYEDQAEKVKFITPLLVGLHGFFFTPGRSLFLFSPPLLLAIPGILILWKRNQHLCIGLLLISIGYLCAMAKWQNWAGGYDWGPRHIYQVTPILMIFCAAYLESIQDWAHWGTKIFLSGLVCLSVFIQWLGLSADPVVVTKEWLQNPTSVLTSMQDMFKMQFSIYLPQFSIPVLHWEWIKKHGQDLLLLHQYTHTGWGIFLTIVLILFGIGSFWLLWRDIKEV